MKTYMMQFFLLCILAIVSPHFFLLDGRSANYEAMRYSIGDSYFYSKILCSTDFAMQSNNTVLTLRGSS